MSFNRYAKRVDLNQDVIVAEARRLGATVEILGLPVDLLVAYRGVIRLWEVKRPKVGKLTPAQIAFRKRWPIPFPEVRSVEDVRRELARIDRTLQCRAGGSCPVPLLFPEAAAST